MGDLQSHEIPAVARRIAHDELVGRVGMLEGELAKERAGAAGLAKQLTCARDELEAHRKVQAEFFAKEKSLTAELARLSAEIETTRSALAEREAAHADAEEGLAQLARELSELQSGEASRSARIAELEALVAERDAAIKASEAATADIVKQLEALSRQLGDRELQEMRLTEQVTDLRAALTEREAAAQAADTARTEIETQLEALSEQLQVLQEHTERQKCRDDELATCGALADKCLFVVGFARSNTTITTELLNAAKNALILGEADFFVGDHDERFSSWFNERHRSFQNQITKSSYAPDFVPERPHTWWQWLESAGRFYGCIGTKIALSDFHLSRVSPDEFRQFHEARFLSSGYIFLLRNPTDALLSTAKLLRVVDDEGMIRLCAAWLDYMQLWADFIRVFPRSITLICERFGETTVDELEAFTGLDLGDAKLLLNPANQRTHKLTGKFPSLRRLKTQLDEIYADAIVAADENRALWQAEQKRTAAANEANGTALGSIALASRPLGRVWLRAHDLRKEITLPRKAANR